MQWKHDVILSQSSSPPSVSLGPIPLEKVRGLQPSPHSLPLRERVFPLRFMGELQAILERIWSLNFSEHRMTNRLKFKSGSKKTSEQIANNSDADSK